MWSLPQSINILVFALIQNVDSIFCRTVDSRILLSCVQEICFCRKKPELRKVIQPLPLVGRGFWCTLERHKSHESKIRQIVTVQSPQRAVWYCVTLQDTAHASCPGTAFKVAAGRVTDPWLLWTFCLNKKLKSYGSGFIILNTLRPHTLVKSRHHLKVKLAPVPSVKRLCHGFVSEPRCGFFHACPSSQVGPRGFLFSLPFAKPESIRFSLHLHSFFFNYTDTKISQWQGHLRERDNFKSVLSKIYLVFHF